MRSRRCSSVTSTDVVQTRSEHFAGMTKELGINILKTCSNSWTSKSCGAPHLAASSMSSVLSQQVFQHDIVQHGIRKQALQLGILVLKGL